MRQARGLVPYAAFAVLIVGATVVALALTTLGRPVTPAASADPSATAAAASAAARPAADLSPNGRLAYWRTEANGDFLLWVANVDNSRRRSIAKAEQPPQISRTRWSVDGSAVGYVESGVRLVVVRLDGASATYTLAPELRADGYRIVDHRSSPSGARIAATVQRVTGSQSDVYVSGAGGTWTRLTTTEDVLAADWISEDELLVQTAGGIIGRLRASGRDQLRPLTGVAGATPIIADDGRVYFLGGGDVAALAGAIDTLVFASSAAVWSITADGEDLRRESVALGADALQLDGQWPGGFLVHRRTNLAQVAVGRGAPIDLPTNAGVIDRLQVAPDRRSGIGFAGTNLVRVDLTANGTVAAATVLLGSIAQGDAWYPRAASLARVAPAAADVPAARFVFALGGHLWTMGADGAPAILRAGNTNANTLRRFRLPPPQWSVAGDKILTTESLGIGGSASQLVATAITRDGSVRRYTTPSSVGTMPTWSPDGRQFAVVSFTGPSTDPSVLGTDLLISVVDAASGAVATTVPGRESFWTRAGLVVLTNGTFRDGDRARDGQSLAIVTASGAQRELTSIARIVADPRTQAPADVRGLTQATGLTASADGAYAAVHIAFLSRAPQAFAIVRSRDGAPTVIVASAGASDEAWAPDGHLLGFTTRTAQPGAPERMHAIVRDADTGDVAVDVDGRFAGWSPDGAWIYVARAEGLFAARLAGGEAVRFSPYGVPVSATKP